MLVLVLVLTCPRRSCDDYLRRAAAAVAAAPPPPRAL